MATPSSLRPVPPRPGAASALLPVQQHSYLSGFGNLLRKELWQWWGTRTWWVHALIWLGIINVFIALIAQAENRGPKFQGMPIHQLASAIFFQISLTTIGIGAVVMAQGAIIGEKQLGTAAWVLSKPVSRTAFMLSKLVGHTVGFAVLAVVLPAVIFYGQSELLWGQVPPLVPFLLAELVTLLNLLFFLALTLMLGTLFGTRGPVPAIALGFLLVGQPMRSILLQLAHVMPCILPDITSALVLGQPVASSAYLPIAGTTLATIVFIGIALWRFGREEFYTSAYVEREAAPPQ